MREFESIGGYQTVTDDYSNSDRLERVLSAQQWRVLSALLSDSSIAAEPIVHDGEILDDEEYLTLCYELHHVLLPELSDEGLVTFDRSEDEVRRGTNFEEMRRFVEQIDDDHSA